MFGDEIFYTQVCYDAEGGGDGGGGLGGDGGGRVEGLGDPREPAADRTAPAEPTEPTEPVVDPTDPEPPTYTPDFKFKYKDKAGLSQEAEFPEYLRGYVDSKEKEDEIRSMLCKAYGLDFVQDSRDTLKGKLEQVTGSFSNYMRGMEELKEIYQSGDLDTFFDVLSLDREKILQWAVQEARYRQLPPEQRQLVERQRTASLEKRDLEAENRQLRETQIQETHRRKAEEVDSVLNSPEYAPLVKAFDQRAGRDGAFKDEMYARGRMAWDTARKNRSAQELAQEIVKLAALSAPAAAPVDPPSSGSPGNTQATKKVIRRAPGGGGSPAAKPIRSIADIQERRKQLMAGG